MNERSSRSHSLLMVDVVGKSLESKTTLNGKLCIVDLAGSENVNKSEAEGERLEEAKHINKSLSALKNVVNALKEKRNHIPYRESCVTRILQDSLGNDVLGSDGVSLPMTNVSILQEEAERFF